MDRGDLERAGLYDPAAPGADGRLALLTYLAEQGASLERMRRAAVERNLPSLALDLVLERGRFTLAELASTVDLPAADVADVCRLLGIDVDPPDARCFDDDDVRLFQLLRADGLVLPGTVVEEVLRSLATSMSTLAGTAVSAFVGTVEDGLAAGDELRWAQVTAASGTLGLELAASLRPLFRHHLRGAVQRQRTAMAVGIDRQVSRLGVGFVDLVGYTAATAAMSPADLIAFTGAFHRRTYDVVTRAGGRVVKHIGDEIMFSALDVTGLCEIGLALVEAFADHDTLPRGGIAFGDLVARYGDLYGAIVNLASRLADIAVPGELLAPADLAELAVDAPVCFEPAGRRVLKGFEEPVAVASVVRPPA
jgi:adenylate cyclase